MTNQPDAAPPDDSTDDLDEGASQSNNLTLTSQQAMAAGIHDPQPGESWTVTLNIGDTSDGVSATILDGSAAKADMPGPNDMGNTGAGETEMGDMENGEDTDDNPGDVSKPDLAVKPAMPSAKKKPNSRVLSPKEAGFSEDGKDMF